MTDNQTSWRSVGITVGVVALAAAIGAVWCRRAFNLLFYLIKRLPL